MKTIALVACSDTKLSEVRYVCERIRAHGLAPLVIDVSTSAGFRSGADYQREDVAREAGVDWDAVEGGSKHELLDLMCQGAAALSARLYAARAFDGILSCGGLQGTTIGSAAMQPLPIGVPKLLVSTVATGQRTFDRFVGIKDIMVMPSISDFAGINVVSRTVLDNAVAAMAGMVNHAGREIPTPTSVVIGTTLMGATNDGVVNAVKRLEGAGREVVSFHSTGAGGKVMEHLIETGVIRAVMDLTLHEVVYEYFGYGFGYGADNRLVTGVEKGVPMVVCPGGIDFMCQWKGALFADADKRKIYWHNSALAHVKLTPKEAVDISRIIIGRLNRSTGPIVVVLPTRGLRSHTRPGEALHDPEVDRAITDAFERELRGDIPRKSIDANFLDEAFSRLAADEMLALLGS